LSFTHIGREALYATLVTLDAHSAFRTSALSR
jgi:hypothetical protein